MSLPDYPVLSTQLCEGIKAWFEQNTYFKDTFDNITVLFKHTDDFFRVDVPQNSMTAVVIYPKNSDTVSQPSKENGQVGIKIVFSPGKQRTERSFRIYSTMAAIRAQLLNNPTYIQTYLSKYYVPGLMYINGQNKIDYDKLNRQILSDASATEIEIVLNYKIGILLNQRALWATGNNFYSPITKVYNTIDEVDVTLVTKNTTYLLSYNVAASAGYSTTGIMLIPPKYVGKGIILGNSGSIFKETLGDVYNSNNSKVKYLYVDTIDTLYLSTGMLVVAENASSGYAAILLGDDGQVYEVVYDGRDFTPVYHQVQTVQASTAYIDGGTLLNVKNASSGYAAILFSNNGNIYNTIVS